jgi:hypothetical protein
VAAEGADLAAIAVVVTAADASTAAEAQHWSESVAAVEQLADYR